MRFDAQEVNQDEAERASRSAGASEVYLRPEAQHNRGLNGQTLRVCERPLVASACLCRHALRRLPQR
jgi:hypothetical protein